MYVRAHPVLFYQAKFTFTLFLILYNNFIETEFTYSKYKISFYVKLCTHCHSQFMGGLGQIHLSSSLGGAGLMAQMVPS